MSLLLDALQRASKDKEKAALAGAVPAPASRPEELTLADKDASEVAVSRLAQAPAVGVPRAAPQPDMVLTLDLPRELFLDAAPPPRPVEAPSNIPVLDSAVPVTPVTPVIQALSPAAPTLAVAAAKPQASPAPSPTSSPANSGRLAQEIRRAYGPAPTLPSSKGRRRVWLWVGLALALGIVLGGVLFVAWLESSSTSLVPTPILTVTPSTLSTSTQVPVSEAPPVPPPPAAHVSAPVPADIERVRPAPVKTPGAVTGRPVAAAQAPQTPGAALADSPASASTSATVPALASVPPARLAASAPVATTDNEVRVLGSDTSKTTFVAKTRGPSPLEVGYAALVAGRLDEAAQAYGQALKANSEERDALLGLAYIAQRQGQREEAQGLYRGVLRQEPGNATASAGLLALDAEADNGQTASRARELALRQPDSAAAMAMAGHAAVRDGLLADAVQLYARAQLLEPGNPQHAYNHAVALDRLGQVPAAAAQYERVLQLADKSPRSLQRAFSVEAVRDRLAQLRQALSQRTDANK